MKQSYETGRLQIVILRNCRNFTKLISADLKNSGESHYPDKAILVILKPLRMVLSSFSDGVPLKFNVKKWQPQVYQYRSFEPSLDPPKYNSLDNTFKLLKPFLRFKVL